MRADLFFLGGVFEGDGGSSLPGDLVPSAGGHLLRCPGVDPHASEQNVWGRAPDTYLQMIFCLKRVLLQGVVLYGKLGPSMEKCLLFCGPLASPEESGHVERSTWMLWGEWLITPLTGVSL